jgi:pimeloyl-ACP methyl ester carboxylesterase
VIVHVHDVGAGAPVVLLHGQPGRGKDWSRVADRLRADHRVLVPDRPGYGSTRLPARGLTENADAVAALIAERDLGPVTVAGHSWGGGVALALAQHYPQHVRGLVLAASIGAPSSIDPIDRVLALPLVGDALCLAGLQVFAPFAKVREFRGHRTWRSFVTEQRAMVAELPALAARLSAIGVPAVVVMGGRDRLLPRRAGTDLAAALPKARVVEVEGVGHALPFEAPDELAAVIREVAAAAA